MKKILNGFGVLAALSIAACGGAPEGGQEGGEMNVSLALVGNDLASTDGRIASPMRLDALLASPLSGGPSAMTVEVGKNVYAAGDGLESLKLFITTIQICEEIDTSGTAYSGGTGCLTLYSGPDAPADLGNTMDVSAALTAAADVTDGYIDVMDATSRAELAQGVTLTSDDARTYNYGVISWAVPIKTTATLVDPTDGTTELLFTRATSPGSCQVNNGTPYDCAISDEALSSGPADEATFASNSDIVFKFQKPLVVSEADITDQTDFSLKLAFNPHGLIQGVLGDTTAGGATNFPPMTDNIVTGDNEGYNLGNTITLVGAQLAPIFYKSTDRVMRETYVATIPASGENGTYDLRVEFYSLESDNERAIYGVSTATIPTADTRGYLTGFSRIYGLDTATDESVSLLDYQDTAQVSDLVRITTVGASTTGKVLCSEVGMDCAGADEDGFLSPTFTLTALEAIE